MLKKKSIAFTNNHLSSFLVVDVKINQVSSNPNFKRKVVNNTLELPE